MSVALLNLAPALVASLLGTPAVVAERHELQVIGDARGRVSALVVATAALAGATSIEVEHSTGAKLTGRLPSGLALTIAGAANALAAKVEPQAPAATLTLSVAALPANVAEGAAVVLADVARAAYLGRRVSSGRRFAQEIGAVAGKIEMTLDRWPAGRALPAGAAAGVDAPPIGALLEGENIFEVLPVLDGTAGAWRVKAGAA